LSEEEDASDSRSTPQTDMQLASVVDRFYARKFSMKAGSGADKKGSAEGFKHRDCKEAENPEQILYARSTPSGWTGRTGEAD
jgi:hypothetical protein